MGGKSGPAGPAFVSSDVTSRLPLCTLLLVLVLAADNVKRVNDTYGHSGGDALLKALANTLVRNFPRKSDMVAQLGRQESVHSRLEWTAEALYQAKSQGRDRVVAASKAD